jgi:hypothetical protein
VPAAERPDPEALAGFESTLESLIQTHEQMLAIARDHRAAIGRADGGAVQACIGQQAVLAARAVDLDSTRKRLSAALSQGREAAGATTISAVAARLPEPSRTRILGLAGRLRELLTALQRENRIIRSATESLLSHMDGLMQQVARTLSHTRLYSPQGRIDSRAPVACGLDVTH